MKTLKILFITILFFTGNSFAQTPTDFLSAEFHKNKRTILRSKMPANSVSVLFSNPIRNRANDVDYMYHQDPNFYYLTGYREPNAVLILFSDDQVDEKGNKYNEILYVQKKNAKSELWTGKRLGVIGAKEKLGFKKAFSGEEFIKSKIDFQKFDTIFVEKFKDDYRNKVVDKADHFDLVKSFKEKTNYNQIVNSPIKFKALNAEKNIEINQLPKNNIDVKFLEKHLATMREIKTEDEVKLLTKAIKISAIGQIEVMKAMKPHMSETELQGIHEFVYKKYGAEYEGYPSIVGSGNNGCILHYIENSKTNVNNELVLMDLGAEYRCYTADVTRTIPSNGKFTKAQKEIYNLVLKAQKAGIALYTIGTSMRAPNQEALKIINQGLFDLGIIKSVNERHSYLPHGTSHHIGLDVHDPGNYINFEENMIVTMEPGIYIPEGSNCDEKYWGIAIRIEDDILITKKGPVNLSEAAPRTIKNIEKMMAKESVLDDFVLPNLD